MSARRVKIQRESLHLRMEEKNAVRKDKRQMKLFRILDMSFSVYEPIANLLIKLKLAKEV